MHREAELLLEITLADGLNKLRHSVEATNALEKRLQFSNDYYFKDFEVLEIREAKEGGIKLIVDMGLMSDPFEGMFYTFEDHMRAVANLLRTNADIFKSMYIKDLSEKKINGYEVLHGAMEEGQYLIDLAMKEVENG